MAEIRLITINEIVKQTPMGGNVGPDKYIFFIDNIQLTVLKPVLGTKLYEKIKTDYNANNLTGLYLQLHNTYIVPFLTNSVYSEYVRNGKKRIVNNGNVVHTPNNARETTTTEDTRSVQHTMNVASYHLEEMEKFLRYEGGNIPEYTQSQDNEYDTKPKNNEGYGLTWYLRS